MIKNLRITLVCGILLITALNTRLMAQDFWQPTSGPVGQTFWTMMGTSSGAYYASTIGGKLYRKGPRESNWQWVYTSSSNSDIVMLFENPADGAIYLSDDQELVTSSNGIDGWTVIHGQGLGVRCMEVTTAGRLIFGSQRGLFTKNDRGDFVEIPFDTSYPYGKWIFSITKGHDGALYAGTSNALYKAAQPDADPVIWEKEVVPLQYTASTFYDLAVKSTGDVYAATGEGLFVNYVNDGNPDWVQIAQTFTSGESVRNIAIGKNDRLFANYSGQALYYSDDDIRWSIAPGTEYSVTRPGFFYDPFADVVIVGTRDGILASAEQNPYSFTPIGLPAIVTGLMTEQPRLFARVAGQEIHESSDGGESWEKFITFPEGIIIDYTERLGDRKYVAVQGGTAAIPGIFVYDESKFGNLWYQLGLPASVKAVTDIHLDSEDVLLIASDDGLYNLNPLTFEPELRSRPVPAVSRDSKILKLLDDTHGNLFAASTHGLYISQDHGYTWSAPLLEGVQINDVTPAFGGGVYVASDGGLYYLPAPDARPQPLGDDNVLTQHQNFKTAVADEAGHVYVIGERGVYYGESLDGPWESHTDGIVNAQAYYGFQVFSNIVYLATEYGLYKHQAANQAIILLSGTGSFVYDGQTHGAPTARTIPAGLTVNIDFEPGVNAGVYPVQATIEDRDYTGTATGYVIIRKAEQTITFAELDNHYSTEAPIVLEATSSAGLPISFAVASGPATMHDAELTFTREPGVVEVKAYQPGSENYFAALDVIRSFEVITITAADDPLDQTLSLYPVPVHADKLTIRNPQTRIRTVQVTDMMGRNLASIVLSADAHEYTLDLRPFPSGLLLITIINERNERVTRRVEVIR